MKLVSRIRILALFAAFFGAATTLLADPTHNPPLVCAARASCSSCPQPDGCACGCILVTLDLGTTTAWTGQTPVYLRIHSSDETASLSTPAQLKVVMGWTFKAVDGGTTAGGAPQIVRFVQPEGAELVVHFQDGDSVGVPEPNNLGKSLARVRMVDVEGWATTSAPAYYDLYPGDGSVWRFLATGNTNERGALVSFTDPRGRVLTPDDFGVDIVRDALGNIRQVKTLTRLADVRTLSPTHYAVTVYPLAEEPEQVADTGLYALPEHAPTRVLDVAQGESVKELLVGFQKGTGDMRQYRYVAVNGDWTLYQPSGLVEAQELYFTEDESGAQRLHTIRDETGKLWSRDEYNYVSAYWGYLITNRIEGIPSDATRTTSWSYYTDGPHKDLLRETIEPTGNRILYEYDDKNRIVRESIPLVEEETLYSYEPVDPSDPPLLCDTRPRCVVRKMQGIEIRRTYYVYGTNGVDIVERVGEQGAAYGGTNVLRTVTTYYPVTGAITDGLVQSVRHEDGTVDDYAYDLTDGVWTETVTHVHEQAPDIVPMRTTRSVRVYNALGRLVDSRTDLCTIGVEDLVPQADWTPIERLQYAYDIDGNEIRREDLAGRLWSSEWAGNCCGKVSETDWQGITTTFAYDADGRLVSTQQGSILTERLYDALGRVIAISSTNCVESLGTPVLHAEYNSLGIVIRESDIFGNWTLHSSSESGLTNMTVYPTGVDKTIVDDVSGRLISVTGSAEPPRFYDYGCNSNGTMWVVRYDGISRDSPSWEKTTFDLLFRPVLKEVPGFGYTVIETAIIYGPNGMVSVRRKTARTPDGFEVILERKLEDQDILGFFRREALDVDGDGLIGLAGTDRVRDETADFKVENGNLWLDGSHWVYPIIGSDEKVRDQTKAIQLTGFEPGCIERRATKDIRGNRTIETVTVDREIGVSLRRVVHPESLLPDVAVSRFGREEEFSSSSGITNRFIYDGLNRRIAVIDGRGNSTTMSYNAFGLIERIHESGGRETVFVYDRFGRNVRIVDAEGGVTFVQYDGRGRITHKEGAVNPMWFSYDERNRMTSLSTSHGVSASGEPDLDTTFWLRDEATGLVTNKTDAAGRSVSYEFTPDGKLARRTWARGVSAVWSYGPDGEWTHVDYSDGTPGVSFERDRMGRIVRAVRDGISETTFEYSAETLEYIREIQNGTEIERFEDNFGRSSGYRLNGRTIRYDRDEFGRFSGIEEVAGFATNRVCYGYLPGSHFLSSMSASSGPAWDRSFEADRDEISAITNRFGPTFVSGFVYRSDRLGRRTDRKESFRDEPATTSRFGYLENCAVETAQFGEIGFSFEYDTAGNRQAVVRTNDAPTLFVTTNRFDVNELNQLTAEIHGTEATEPETFQYDEDGNLIAARGWSFEWDAENRLMRAFRNTTAPGEAEELHFAYDPWGRLVRSTTRFADGSREAMETVYDDWNPVREIQIGRSGTTNETRYLWGLDISGTLHGAAGIGGLISVHRNDGTFCPAYDANGNVVSYQDESGETVARYEYGAFGELISSTGPLQDSFEHRFSTKRIVPQLGWYWYGHRFYDSKTGRWISRDPLEEQGGLNLYQMVGNDVINKWDYLGMIDARSPVDRCSNMLGDFISRNSTAFKEYGLTLSTSNFNSLTTDVSKIGPLAASHPDSLCRVSWKCSCTCRPGEAGVTTRFRHSGIYQINNGSQTQPFPYKFTISYVDICAKVQDKYQLERTFMHEIQHARDNCNDDALKVSEPCNILDNACDCATELCKEIRAYASVYGKTNALDVYQTVERAYYTRRSTFTSYACRRALEKGVSRQRMREMVSEKCNTTDGIIPRNNVNYSNP